MQQDAGGGKVKGDDKPKFRLSDKDQETFSRR